MLTELTLEQVRVDPDNAYAHNDAEVQRLVGVISEHGVLTAVCVDAETGIPIRGADGLLTTNYQLVGGEARIGAYQALNIQRFPAIIETFPNRLARAAAALALNGNYGHWDPEKLAITVQHLNLNEYDTDYTGLEPWVIEDLLADVNAKAATEQPQQDYSTLVVRLPQRLIEQYERIMGRMGSGSEEQRFERLLDVVEGSLV